MPRRQIPNLPGGALHYVVRRAQNADKRARAGLRPVDPRTMDPKLKAFLKKIGAL